MADEGDRCAFSVIGGDKRLLFAARRLHTASRRVKLCGFELLENEGVTNVPLSEALGSDALVFGLPFTKNGISLNAPYAKPSVSVREMLSMLPVGKRVFLGGADDRVTAQLSAVGARVYDYFRDPVLLERNARLTAEALLGFLITELPVGLSGLPVGVVGAGRIALSLTGLLVACGADVTVFARDRLQLARATLLGADAAGLSDLGAECRPLAALVNTVPAPVAGADVLCALPKNCLLLEAASAPFGIDETAAEQAGMRLIRASFLPGRFSPESAGAYIADAIEAMSREVK
ncbi:MAG: hypothetical protein IJK02_01860 [Clostridia bacterium]|nr:hypothetical protein [Clostridia bacterium]